MEPTAEAQYVSAAPAPALRPYLAPYVGYRLTDLRPGVHRGLPSRYLTLVVSLAEPSDLVVRSATDGLVVEGPGGFDALAGGLHAGPVLLPHDGNQYGVQLALTPSGARALFARPAGELGSLVIGLDGLLGRAAASRLVERLRAAPGWPARWPILDEVLLGCLRDRTGPARPELDWAWHRLVQGRTGIDELATEVGWSRRHLASRFRHEYGLTPKVTARMIRFSRSARMLTRPGWSSLAEVAASAGYADQAHLARDWQEFAGCPPSVWVAEELPWASPHTAEPEFPSVQADAVLSASG